MSKVTISSDIDRVSPEDLPRYTAIALDAIIGTINGNLDFQTNFNAKTSSVIFSAANTDTAVIHGLGRVPIGYIVYGTTAAMSIYDGATPSTSQLLYLRASATGTARILIY
jgi:hypothetical protein